MIKIICGIVVIGLITMIYRQKEKELFLSSKYVVFDDYFFDPDGKEALEIEQVNVIFGHIYFKSKNLNRWEKLFVNSHKKLDFNGNYCKNT